VRARAIKPGIGGTEMIGQNDRENIARATAKAIAYANCGKQEQAEAWAAELVRLLQCAAILRPGIAGPLVRDVSTR
jgi:hypothetical protein